MMWRIYPLAIGAAVACLGYGCGLGRLLGIAPNLGDAGVLGLACLAILGCALHFVSALSTAVQMAVLGVGLALCVVCRRELLRQCRGNLVAILAGLSAFLHRYAVTSYDNGYYHLQAVKWNSEFPITPGLANLNSRLGYNSALFVVAPLDDLAGAGWVSGMLLLSFVLISCYQRFSQARRDSMEFWFFGLAAATLALGSGGPLGWLGVLNGDGFVAILTAYCVCLALTLPARPQTDAPLLLLAGALALTVKLSAAPLFLLALLAAWFHRKTVGGPLPKTLAIAALLLGLWMARGVVLSGCAAFPLPQSCGFDLPWAVSRNQVQLEAFAIRSWARAPHRIDYAAVMAGWEWLRPWTIRTCQDWSVRLCMFGVIAVGVAMWFGARLNRMALATFAGLCLSLAYWFSSAPDPRFAGGYLATAGILGLSVACAICFRGSDVLRRLVIQAAAVSALVGAAGLVQFGNTWTVKNPPPVVTRIAPGGKPIAVTVIGREGSDQCWDRPLPCTPVFDPEALKRVRWR